MAFVYYCIGLYYCSFKDSGCPLYTPENFSAGFRMFKLLSTLRSFSWYDLRKGSMKAFALPKEAEP